MSLMGDNEVMEMKATSAFIDWLDGLKDLHGRARVQVRLRRLGAGNPGQHRNLKGGVTELKVPTGPGYRVYYTERGPALIILLCGGDKSTQKKDIKRAQHMVKQL